MRADKADAAWTDIERLRLMQFVISQAAVHRSTAALEDARVTCASVASDHDSAIKGWLDHMAKPKLSLELLDAWQAHVTSTQALAGAAARALQDAQTALEEDQRVWFGAKQRLENARKRHANAQCAVRNKREERVLMDISDLIGDRGGWQR